MKNLWVFCFLICHCLHSSFVFAEDDYDKQAAEAFKRALLKDEESSVYKKAYQEALRTQKPLIIWIGTVCPKCEREMSWAIHVHLDVFLKESSYRVIIGRTEGGKVLKVKEFYKIPTAEEVKEALNPPVARAPSYPQYQWSPPIQQQCPS